MNTLYTFGCSFTNYCWPTWANIVAYDLNMTLKNYGQVGMGNFGIANRILEVNERIGVDEDDKLLVLWSSWDREDRLKQNQWRGEGSVFSNDEIYGRKWIRNFYDDSDKIMKNVFWIHSVNKLYGKNINWQGSGFDYYRNDTFFEETPAGLDQDARKLIKIYGHLMPKVFHWVNAEDSPSFGYFRDKHPDIKRHMALVEDHIYPKLGKKLRKETRQLFNEVSYSFETNKKFFKPRDDESTASEEHLKKYFPEVWNQMDRSCNDLADGTKISEIIY
jgi:hypothetical protein|tara:strand:- start:2853 stop:3677 length:825 start_codon:yes stop_codon:yes gene_type:complete